MAKKGIVPAAQSNISDLESVIKEFIEVVIKKCDEDIDNASKNITEPAMDSFNATAVGLDPVATKKAKENTVDGMNKKIAAEKKKIQEQHIKEQTKKLKQAIYDFVVKTVLEMQVNVNSLGIPVATSTGAGTITQNIPFALVDVK